jgi:hypothetical protein
MAPGGAAATSDEVPGGSATIGSVFPRGERLARIDGEGLDEMASRDFFRSFPSDVWADKADCGVFGSLAVSAVTGEGGIGEDGPVEEPAAPQTDVKVSLSLGVPFGVFSLAFPFRLSPALRLSSFSVSRLLEMSRAVPAGNGVEETPRPLDAESFRSRTAPGASTGTDVGSALDCSTADGRQLLSMLFEEKNCSVGVSARETGSERSRSRGGVDSPASSSGNVSGSSSSARWPRSLYTMEAGPLSSDLSEG